MGSIKEDSMSIKQWPIQEQPRERLLNQGASSLSDAELLAIFLRTGTRGQSAVDLARNMIAKFGTLAAIINADLSQFCNIKGLGIAKYVQLHAVMEIASRCHYQNISEQQHLTSPQTTRDFLLNQLSFNDEEIFAVLYLNQRHTPIHFEELFRGTIDCATVYPRVVVKNALKYNAAAIIIAHNHPSGVAEPSMADERITLRLQKALQLVDIRLLDHFVVGQGELTSMAELGKL